MALVLRAIALNEERIGRQLMARFDERGGTVGRSDEATLNLPDPQRLISRLQARILYCDGHYWIENLSRASEVRRNGRQLAVGMRVALHEGDLVNIGGYALLADRAVEQERTAVLYPAEHTAVLNPHERMTCMLDRSERTAVLYPEEHTAVLSSHERMTRVLNWSERTAVPDLADHTAVLSPYERTGVPDPYERTVVLSPHERM